MRLALLSAWMALPLLACPATPNAPPGPDASDAGDAASAACARMRSIGCGDVTADCEGRLRLDGVPPVNHTTQKAVVCVATATDKPSIRACDPTYFACP